MSWADDEKTKWLPLVVKIAERFNENLPQDHFVEMGDLVGWGYLGLRDAMERYDSKRGVKFHNFAKHRIVGAIKDGLRSIDPVSRLDRGRIKKEDKGIDLKLPEDSRRALAAARTFAEPVSLSYLASGQPIPSTDTSRYSVNHAYARELLRVLPEKHRRIVVGCEISDLTLREVGEYIGISESRACQIYAEAMLVFQLLDARPKSGEGIGVYLADNGVKWPVAKEIERRAALQNSALPRRNGNGNGYSSMS